VWPATKYAAMLGERLKRYNSRVWLVNTGWTGGPYGVGKRMPLAQTRTMVRSLLAGGLDNVQTVSDPIFGLAVPTHVSGVSDTLLRPREAWGDAAAYDQQAQKLAGMFRSNFEKFASTVDAKVVEAGPKG
jgi:phosphoenolpyruvate carboxykinase (ATP)